MGCETSSGVEPSKAQFSPLVRNIPTNKKKKIAKAIEEDDLPELAVLMEQIGASPNSQISDQGMMWMLNHLCCRWDADNCLEYLLKQYFATNPKVYIDYVNALTFEGYAPLHLCGLWKAQKCFHVLNHYGGLNLVAKDKMYRTPKQCAAENRCKNMKQILDNYNQMRVSFTNIEVQKLLSGEIISEEPKKSERTSTGPKVQADPRIKSMTGLLFNEINREAAEKKKQLEEEKQRLLQEKLKKQQQADEQKKRLQAQRNEENDELQRLKEIQKKREEEKKKYEEKLRVQQEEMKKLQQQMQKEEQDAIMQKRAQQMRKAQEAATKEKEALLRRVNTKLSVINALKKKKEENPVKEVAPEKQMRQSVQPSKPKDEIPQKIMELYQKVKSSGSKFEDSEFPAKNQTLGDHSKAKSKGLLNNTVWLRPSEIFKSNYQLFEGIDPNDVKQGSLGVCYMLATISALAKCPKNIENLFSFYDLELGFYVLRLYIHGKVQYVVVDDQIPCNELTKSPLFTKPIGNQIWVLLMEKAWAKVVGDYLSAEAMTPDHIMQDLSGAPGSGSWFSKGNEGKSATEKIQQVIDHLKLKHIVVFTSGDKKIDGIANNHAYTVLDVYEVKGRFLFKIRNPWGRFEWNGEYGDNSSLWTEDLRKKVGNDNKDDGIFFLTENQVLEAFVYYSISEIKDNYSYSWQQFASNNNQNIFYQFSLTNKEQINIRITQPFDRMIKDSSYKHSPMIFETGKIEADGTVTFLSEGHQRAYFGAKSVHAFEQITRVLDAGDYFIRIKMLWHNPNKYNKAVIAVYSPKPVQLTQLNQDEGIQYAKQLMISFGATKQRIKTGAVFYKILTMRGQFAFIGETDEDDQYKIQFTFTSSKMDKCEADWGKVRPEILEMMVAKGQPGVVTAMRTQPAQGGTTGPVSIMGSKV